MKITQQELLDIIRESINDIDPEDERIEELISVIYDKMREMSADNREEQEENFKAAKIEIVDDLELDKNDLKILNSIGLDDILKMRGRLTLEQETTKITSEELRKIIKEETEQVLSEFEE